MGKKMFICCLLFVCFSCSKQTLELNSIFMPENNNTNYYMLGPDVSFHKSYSVTMNNVEYSVAVSNQNRIIFVSTRDSSFTVGKLKVGDEVPKEKFKKYHSIPGWGTCVPISSGWYAGYYNESESNENVKIQFFIKCNFKR